MNEALTEAAGRRDSDPVTALWDNARARLRQALPDSTFQLWLEPLRAVALRGGTIYLVAPEGIRAWVERRYSALLEEAVTSVAGSPTSISFERPGPAVSSARPPLMRNPSYTFERFVIGEGNRLAHAAALAVAEAPAEAYNPLFLHGPPGLGKTHLMVAIANYLALNAPDLSVLYTTAERFTSEFVSALHRAGAEEFKRIHRDVDVLLIDDVQFLEGKHHTEEEFFHTFNALHEAGSQIVLSADRLPSELSTLADRLRDRFEWGLTVALEQPNLATRLTVLRRLVTEAGVDSPDRDALTELARRIPTNVRQLHGALTRVLAHASLLARPLSADLVADVLPGKESPAPGAIDTEAIQEAVCSELGLSRAQLVGSGRDRSQVEGRQLAMHLCRELTDLSLPQIGRSFGGRDHSTVLNALRRFQAEVEINPTTRQRLARVHSRLHSHGGASREIRNP